jgi:hypothetical protein
LVAVLLPLRLVPVELVELLVQLRQVQQVQVQQAPGLRELLGLVL